MKSETSEPMARPATAVPMPRRPPLKSDAALVAPFMALPTVLMTGPSTLSAGPRRATCVTSPIIWPCPCSLMPANASMASAAMPSTPDTASMPFSM